MSKIIRCEHCGAAAAPQPQLSTGYRWLEEGELIQPGDDAIGSDCTWYRTAIYGTYASRAYKYRRLQGEPARPLPLTPGHGYIWIFPADYLRLGDQYQDVFGGWHTIHPLRAGFLATCGLYRRSTKTTAPWYTRIFRRLTGSLKP